MEEPLPTSHPSRDEETQDRYTSVTFRSVIRKLPPVVLPEGMSPQEYIQQRMDRIAEAAKKVSPEDWAELSEAIQENRRRSKETAETHSGK